MTSKEEVRWTTSRQKTQRLKVVVVSSHGNRNHPHWISRLYSSTRKVRKDIYRSTSTRKVNLCRVLNEDTTTIILTSVGTAEIYPFRLNKTRWDLISKINLSLFHCCNTHTLQRKDGRLTKRKNGHTFSSNMKRKVVKYCLWKSPKDSCRPVNHIWVHKKVSLLSLQNSPKRLVLVLSKKIYRLWSLLLKSTKIQR